MQTKYQQTIGVDEAGRGAWAGPVVAAASVVVDKQWFQEHLCMLQELGLHDSKKMTKKSRNLVFEYLIKLQKEGIIEYCVAFSSSKIIDNVGIKEANRKAIRKAITQMPILPTCIWIDGNDAYRFRWIPMTSLQYIIRWDSQITEIMMASILAKVSRDRYMIDLHSRYPKYWFDRHKGYGTKLHQETLQTHGPCCHHRFSYEPVGREMRR